MWVLIDYKKGTIEDQFAIKTSF